MCVFLFWQALLISQAASCGHTQPDRAFCQQVRVQPHTDSDHLYSDILPAATSAHSPELWLAYWSPLHGHSVPNSRALTTAWEEELKEEKGVRKRERVIKSEIEWEMAFRGVDRGQLLSNRRMKAQPTRSGGLEGAASTDLSHSSLDGVHITCSGNTHTDMDLSSNMLKCLFILAHSYIHGV